MGRRTATDPATKAAVMGSAAAAFTGLVSGAAGHGAVKIGFLVGSQLGATGKGIIPGIGLPTDALKLPLQSPDHAAGCKCSDEQ